MLRYLEKPVSGRLARSIEDAILFGDIREIDAILERVDGDESFPEDLRYGLEALRHFRAHYADRKAQPQISSPSGGDAKEAASIDLTARQIRLIESSWAAELLEMLHGERKDQTQNRGMVG